MTKKKDISKEDLDTWTQYIKNPEDLIDKDAVYKQKDSKSLRFRYDLHGYSLIDANKKIEELIIFCAKKNYKEILLITGKGIHSNTDRDVYVSKNLSKLKYSVPDFIKLKPNLMKIIKKIEDASVEDGGQGVFYIFLKKFEE